MNASKENPTRDGIHLRLRNAIMQSGKTYADLEEQAELGEGVVAKYARKRCITLPTAYTLAKLCRAMGVSADEILGLKGG